MYMNNLDIDYPTRLAFVLRHVLATFQALCSWQEVKKVNVMYLYSPS